MWKEDGSSTQEEENSVEVRLGMPCYFQQDLSRQKNPKIFEANISNYRASFYLTWECEGSSRKYIFQPGEDWFSEASKTLITFQNGVPALTVEIFSLETFSSKRLLVSVQAKPIVLCRASRTSMKATTFSYGRYCSLLWNLVTHISK